MKQSTSQEITKKSGSNLALSFFSLSKERQNAMAVFYAFCRVADDIVDRKPMDEAACRQDIAFWRSEVDACYDSTPASDLGRELADIVQHYNIPRHLLHALLDGVEMDLNKRRYASFEKLREYCYRVASVVGLVSINIFGCRHPRSQDYAVALGMAFQLTNILRDVRFDLEEYDRVYLPQDEMAAFGVEEKDLLQDSEKTRKLFRLQYFRAKHFYNRAKRFLPAQDFHQLAAARVMTEVYGDVLEKIRRKNFDVLKQKIELTKSQKILAAIRIYFGRARKPKPCAPPKQAAVWGAGFAGLSAALHFALEGHHVEVFESKSFLGGRANSFQDAQTGQTLDNGQHAFMGCYHACWKLFDLLGIRDRFQTPRQLNLHFASAKQKVSQLTASSAPAPFHLLGALRGFSELTRRDRFSILGMGLRLKLSGKPKSNETALDWLRRWKQTPGAIRALWEPLGIAALNEPLDRADAGLLFAVLKKSIFGSREDSAVVLSQTGLSELWEPEARLYLQATGGRLHLGEGVKEIRFNKTGVENFLTTQNETKQKDAYISALTPKALAGLLPKTEFQRSLQNIHGSPILSVYLWTDQPLIHAPIVGLLDSPVQWIFDRTERSQEPCYAVVISAAREFENQTTEQIVEFVLKEVHRLLPSTQNITVKHRFLYRAREATFAGTPEEQAYRPSAKTPWRNLFLAGDWTQTGLPCTLEGAAQSGQGVVSAVETAG